MKLSDRALAFHVKDPGFASQHYQTHFKTFAIGRHSRKKSQTILINEENLNNMHDTLLLS